MDPVEEPAPSAVPSERGLEMSITRSRHEPRLCHRCQSPMAGQSDRCWKCGQAWAPRPHVAGRRPSLRESATNVQEVRARRHDDAKRRERAPATRAGAATAPKEA